MMQAVTLERASAADCEQLWRMQIAAFLPLLERYHDHELNPASEPCERVAARLAQPETYYYFILAGGEKVGAIRVVDAKDGSRKRISPLCILPEQQNRGYAQAAMREAEKLHGAANWALSTILQEAGNCHLYEKMGYHRTGKTNIINEHMTLVYYEKDIDMEIRQITNAEEKRAVSRYILEALPEWFEVAESRENYIRESDDKLFFAAYDGENAVGFLYLKQTGKDTAELAVMGVLKAYHRKGVGRMLTERAKAAAQQAGYSFLQVKTVKMGMYEDYDRTNLFYLAAGFKEFEVFPTLWDEANPCQVYVMSLK